MNSPDQKSIRAEYARNYRKNNSARVKQHVERWRAKNKQKVDEYNLAYQKKYREAHRKEAIDYQKIWRANNKPKRKLYRRTRRAKLSGCAVEKRGVAQFYESARKSKLVSCYWCQTLVTGQDCHIDHIIPLVKGGKHAIENLCTSCCDCNRKKAGRLPHEWRGLPQFFLTI